MQALEKVDVVKDNSLDQVEFMLLALDRAIIFSQENLELLFKRWDHGRQGCVPIFRTLRLMFDNADGSENEEKLLRFYGQLTDLNIVDHERDDRIEIRHFLTICRDIFGINTFEIEQEVEQLEPTPSEPSACFDGYVEGDVAEDAQYLIQDDE